MNGRIKFLLFLGVIIMAFSLFPQDESKLLPQVHTQTVSSYALLNIVNDDKDSKFYITYLSDNIKLDENGKPTPDSTFQKVFFLKDLTHIHIYDIQKEKTFPRILTYNNTYSDSENPETVFSVIYALENPNFNFQNKFNMETLEIREPIIYGRNEFTVFYKNGGTGTFPKEIAFVNDKSTQGLYVEQYSSDEEIGLVIIHIEDATQKVEIFQ
jgi:hypothetical protein